ncbi:uncharacterized protein KZ484_007486 [Pholidichthys leucotaenia]
MELAQQYEAVENLTRNLGKEDKLQRNKKQWKALAVDLDILLIDPFIQPISGDSFVSDERPDVERNNDLYPNALKEQSADALDLSFQPDQDATDTNWDEPDTNKDRYGDADWHPPTSLLETHVDLIPDAPLLRRSGSPSIDENINQTFNQMIGNSSEQCGEFSSQLTSNGHCRLTATLPPVGTSQKQCPDMFRCTDDISYWLHENEDKKVQLEELRETMSELQEELRNHRHRVKALEMQRVDESALQFVTEFYPSKHVCF